MVSSKDISKILEQRRKGIKEEKSPEPSAPQPKTESAVNKCESCGLDNPQEAKFCVGCGEVLQKPLTEDKKVSEHKICPNCRTKNKIEAKFCVACGHRFEPEPKSEEELQETPLDTINDEAKTEEPAEEIEKESEEIVEEDETGPEKVIIEEDDVETEVNEIPEVKQVPISTTPLDVPPDEGEELEKESPVAYSDVDPVEKIKKAKELLDMGAITETEFEKIKDKYLRLI